MPQRGDNWILLDHSVTTAEVGSSTYLFVADFTTMSKRLQRIYQLDE